VSDCISSESIISIIIIICSDKGYEPAHSFKF